ncbi:MAG: hypothetical protein LBD50_02680 [Rickettsiales bacterium]|jgi:hypothetical protein|nr:hypothetical protein [Rickettsiales bacterium]
MLTKIDLCSLALLKLGEPPIQSLNDDSAAARLARTLFDPAIDSLTAAHPWNFAKRKFDLIKTADGDFQIPANALRVLHCKGEIVGDKILASGDSIRILAIVRAAAENFPAYFASLAATKLAMEFCIPLLGDQSVFRMLAALYESELRAAKFIDSTLSATGDIAEFSLISSRF